MTEKTPRQDQLPELVTLDDAFRAAYYLTQAYVDLERDPDEGLVLFLQSLASDPARWDDWKDATRTALVDGGAASRTSKATAA
jgi:hypothetical protein